LFVCWELAVRADMLDSTFFPAPSTIWSEGVESVRLGILQDAIVVSARKVLIGYFLGVITGLIVGLGLGMSRTARAALEPLLVAFYVIPKLAILPVLLLIFGLSETPQIILIGMTVFFVVAIPTIAGVRDIAPGYLDAARSFEATRWQLFRHVVLPGSMPAIGTALRLGAGMSVLVMVGAELLQGGKGLGYLIWNSWQIFIPARMYAGIVVVAVLGVLFTGIVTVIVRILVPWDDRSGRL
jgi:ABC-type nitrate/sulfonate/bicarbonate transport system permease component